MSSTEDSDSPDLFNAYAQGAVVVKCSRGPVFSPTGQKIGPISIKPDMALLRTMTRDGAVSRVQPKPLKGEKPVKQAKPQKAAKTAAREEVGKFDQNKWYEDRIEALEAELKAARENAVTDAATGIGASAIKDMPLERVTFHTPFGTVKSKVRIIEDAMAIGLVFVSEDDIMFTPTAGETIEITIQGKDKTRVYYPNVIFTWIDRVSKIMVLIKSQEDNE